MKNLILILFVILISGACKETPDTIPRPVRDGFYQVMKLGNDFIPADSIEKGQVVITFDTLFNPDDYTKVAIDTTDYVPLELETMPEALPQTDTKKLLSITFTPFAAEKIQTFTAQRVMKQAVVVVDGKAITMHRIREAITGNKMQITRCDDNACEYLYVKMKGDVKR